MDALSLGLNPIQEKAVEKLSINALTPMQEASLFACREPQDVVLLSPTGSGKTLAYLLPLLERMLPSEEGVQALVIVPSRELAIQIEQVFKSMSTPMKAMAVYGGRPAMDEHRTMKGICPSLVVGTPGRLNDHLKKGNIDSSGIRTLVIDEFDKCLELGFYDEMKAVLEQLPSLERRWLSSATDIAEMPDFLELRRYVKLDYLSAPRAEGAASVSDRIAVSVVHSPDKDKLAILFRLLCFLGGEQTIVFCNYREGVERIGQYLTQQKIVHAVYHGGLEQEMRERALYKFRNGSVNVLISTDLASRGLDIPEVRHIVHYHLPLSQEASVHRSGRTARWDAEGDVIFLLGPEENVPEYLKEFSVLELPDKPKRPTPPLWETIYIGKGKKDKINKVDIAGFLYKKGNLTKDDLGLIDVQDRYSYVAVRRSKVKQLLSLVDGEKIKGLKTIIVVAK
ncbi:MAG: DEAD/DEAH box helicase [Bacteroidaceae bacterium]|nr:DEAD/DEAH box helicase [Bacteroidaceae bacterium]